MSGKEIEQFLRRGLGDAIVFLEKCTEKAKYREIVLRCCLHDITYDWQCEGTKGFYLHSAICALGAKEEFEPLIINKFLTNCKTPFFYQLSEILSCYAKDGNYLSINAFFKKYDYYKTKRALTNDEYQQWEDIVVELFYLEGFMTFKRYIAELNTRKTDGGCLDWFLIRSEDTFGKKKIKEFFEKNYADSDFIKKIVDKIYTERVALDKELEQRRANPPQQEKASLDELIQAIMAAEDEKHPRAKFAKVKRKFLMNATSADIVPLLEYAQSSNALISEIAVECLAEFKDKRIHDLAIQLLTDNRIAALELLVKNYKKADDDVIIKAIKKSSIPHDVQMDFRDIYLKNKSKYALPALLRVYQKGECGFCRYYIIKAMENCGVLSDDLLDACLHDSYDDTREFAKHIAKKRVAADA